MVYTTNENEVISILMMLVLYATTYIYILSQIKLNLPKHILFFLAVALRIGFTITDTYFFSLPHSGMDSVMFENHANTLLNGSLSLSMYNYDNYPKFIYLIYLLIGRKPLVIRAINGCLSLITANLVYKSILKISGDRGKSSDGMLLFLLFPQSLIFSSIIMRESLIVFFATLSVWLFINYVYSKKMLDLFTSLLCLLLGSLFHSGIILIAAAYFFFILIEKNKTKNNISIKKAVIIMTMVILSIWVLSNSDIFLRKFHFITSLESIIDRINYTNTIQVGSGYLNNYTINSFGDLILYVPLKIVYFLFSPMIWDIRGLQDLIAILFDSVFYLVLTINVIAAFFGKCLNKRERLLIKALIFACVLVIGAYSMGTIAAGTAIRHRYKVLSFLIIITFTQSCGIIRSFFFDRK
ncbi:MAG: hypothetical protein ACOX23_07285 [Peptococcia bacterium]